MASSSGNSSGSTQILQNSGSEGDLQVIMDQRKRKRMQSNRESARRSRMRKQKHLDDLMAQVSQIKKENNQIHTSTTITTEHYLNIEAENSVLRAQMDELSQRLQSLNDILNYMNMMNTTTNNNNEIYDITEEINQQSIMDPWNLMYLNQQQPIMASANMFLQY
ncbi:hypothetical protein LguiA_006792 [Lonicera macranthoides]